MRRTVAVAACVVGAFATVASAETLLDVDFTKNLRNVDNSKAGVCRGVLPEAVNDDFSTWSGGRCLISLLEDDGVKYLRFSADAANGPVQFALPVPKIKVPGFFRLCVKGRVHGESMGIGLRMNAKPYTAFSSHRFGSPDWDECTYLFQVKKKVESGIGLYLYPGNGETELRRITLEKVDRADLARKVKRPPPEKRVFVNRRFLLGLPNGWNDDRHTETGIVEAASDAESSVPVLRISSEKDKTIAVWGEPFQTNDPSSPHVVSFRCRGAGEWTAQIVTDKGTAIRDFAVNPGASWRVAKFDFKPSDLDAAFAVKFSGSGELFLDDLRVGIGNVVPDRPFAADCALAPSGGEIAGISRIWFADERPRVSWAVADAPAGAVLKLSFADLYGRSASLAEIPLKGGAFEKGEIDPSAAIADRMGQFRITAEVFAGGKAASDPDEFVFTRILRPVGWGRDMPDSPFGAHMEPRPATVATLKACGINWTRIHDAAARCTGWWALEREKGKWSFRDESINRFRRNHIKIFAQLGTAPAWATRYNDLGCKRMGYFEKYLRPVDTNGWLNYVTTVVKRYKGVIDEYFVWNEPWGAWWKYGADAKYYDKERSSRDFADFQSVTYKAVKAVDPKIRVSGFNTYGANHGADWTEGVADGGGWETCDMVDYHVYTPDTRARRGDLDYASIAFRPLLAKHPKLDGKPVYMSEGQGTSTASDGGGRAMSGLYERTIPWKAETPREIARVADDTCRYTLSLLAAGDARVFLYTASNYMGLVAPPRFTVLVGADGYPYPSLAAYSFFTHALEGCTFRGRADYGIAGCVYTFRSEGARHPVVRLYTSLTLNEANALDMRTPLKDLYGNRYDASIWFKGTLLYSFGK